MSWPSVRRFFAAAALVLAAVVLTHIATCRVVHAVSMAEMPVEAHLLSVGDHLPDAVLGGLSAAALLGLLGLLVIRLIGHAGCTPATVPVRDQRCAGRSPPDRASHNWPSPIALCVFRC